MVFLSWEKSAVPNSVLEAIKMGIWDFDPGDCDVADYKSTAAMPGTEAKLAVLADRLRNGLPLWHPHDRRSYDDSDLAER
jgi:hypothetical protein